MPLHIVFLELIIDPICSIAFESEKEELEIMKRPPRNPDEQFFGFKKIFSGISKGLLLLAMVFIVYFLSLNEAHTEGEVRAIAFTALVIGNMFLILTTLSKTRNAIQVLAEKNLTLLLILITASGALILLLGVPYFNTIFGFEYPGAKHFVSAIIGSVAVLIVLESAKYFRYKKLSGGK